MANRILMKVLQQHRSLNIGHSWLRWKLTCYGLLKQNLCHILYWLLFISCQTFQTSPVPHPILYPTSNDPLLNIYRTHTTPVRKYLRNSTHFSQKITQCGSDIPKTIVYMLLWMIIMILAKKSSGGSGIRTSKLLAKSYQGRRLRPLGHSDILSSRLHFGNLN